MKPSNNENIEEFAEILAETKELINHIDRLQIEKENLIAVIFSLQVLMMYSEQSKPTGEFTLM
jgi:hypothetical protein